ncbi:MAG TPA: hypothetical protein VJQ48_11795 [Candidatus Binatia bacterium]|nr:hypothetical protein [Candidatus Binatia bacterium]
MKKPGIWAEDAPLHSPAAALKFDQLKANTFFWQIAHSVNHLPSLYRRAIIRALDGSAAASANLQPTDEVLPHIALFYHDQSDGETAIKQRCADNVLVYVFPGNMFAGLTASPCRR